MKRHALAITILAALALSGCASQSAPEAVSEPFGPEFAPSVAVEPCDAPIMSESPDPEPFEPAVVYVTPAEPQSESVAVVELVEPAEPEQPAAEPSETVTIPLPSAPAHPEPGHAFCDSCGEQYPISELTERYYCPEWGFGLYCDICIEYWDEYID